MAKISQTKSVKKLTSTLSSTIEKAKSLGINTDKADAMVAQTKAEGSKSFAGSSAEKDYIAKSGITTSDSADNRAKNAESTLAGLTVEGTEKNDPLAEMSKRLAEMQKQLQNKQVSSLNAASTIQDTVDSGKKDLNKAADAINGQGDSSSIEDPVIRALTDKVVANTGIINTQMNALSQYRKQFDQYVQEDIDSIARTAERSINTQIAENDRARRAMEFAGVVGGRAQFSPILEESIIHDVIQEGLDKIEVINEKKNTAIREARKAQAEFNIDVFEQQSNLAKEYNTEVATAISEMNTQVRQVEADERQRITFRQEQEKRASEILADELIDASPVKIMQTAAMNGLDYSILAKAVSDAKYNKTMQSLDIESKRASIANSWAQYRNAVKEDKEKSDMPDKIRERFRSAQLSNDESEQVWADIKEFGLNGDTVKMWVESGEMSKAQAKAIVGAHEEERRVKSKDDNDNDIYLPSETEKALYREIDMAKTPDQIKNQKDREKLDKFIGTSFFK